VTLLFVRIGLDVLRHNVHRCARPVNRSLKALEK
jgi:hypothetical protein